MRFAGWSVVLPQEVNIKLRELIERVPGAAIKGNPDLKIESVEYDSRLVKPNGLFVAVKGYKLDGYDFVPQAKEAGAVAVMGERESCSLVETHVTVPDVRKAMSDVGAAFYGYPGLKLKNCGVTGTNGKTTTCYLIRGILEAYARKTGMITTQIYNNGKEIIRARRTTPESLDLQRLLSQMVGNGCINAVIEVSSHALVLRRVENIDFSVAVYTNLTRDHLDFHETMENYLQAKALLARKLDNEDDRVVINFDVPEFRSLPDNLATPFIGYSLSDSKADVYCDGYDIEPHGTTFNLVTPKGSAKVRFALPGRFNLINAVAAAAGAVACGADLNSIVKGLEAATPVPGRFNYVDAGQPFAIYIDYAHTPDAIERLCQSAREISQGKLLLLFGCGGDRDRGKRPMMGKSATTSADYVVVTSDNPRTEDPLAIIEDIKPGLQGGNYVILPDRTKAIKSILEMAKPGDVVLLAGKGDENYQEIHGVRHHFSDAEQAKTVLREMRFK
ncbi:MAG: UDP-N-acetylmuramoyl-L-alanyl-D-glutamate--2,6-diaminopimelate ligase [Candidatus Zixiibacteriota bacterium]